MDEDKTISWYRIPSSVDRAIAEGRKPTAWDGEWLVVNLPSADISDADAKGIGAAIEAMPDDAKPTP